MMVVVMASQRSHDSKMLEQWSCACQSDLGKGESAQLENIIQKDAHFNPVPPKKIPPRRPSWASTNSDRGFGSQP
jgi:hypothetical protein